MFTKFIHFTRSGFTAVEHGGIILHRVADSIFLPVLLLTFTLQILERLFSGSVSLFLNVSKYLWFTLLLGFLMVCEEKAQTENTATQNILAFGVVLVLACVTFFVLFQSSLILGVMGFCTVCAVGLTVLYPKTLHKNS